MSKLFTFYNLEIEDSALVYVFNHDETNYGLLWDSAGFKEFVKPKQDIDAKIKSGAYQIVQDFRKVSNNA